MNPLKTVQRAIGGFVSGGDQDLTASQEHPAVLPGDDCDTTRDRGEVLGAGLKWLASWSLRLLLIVGALAAVLWLVGKFWVGVLPLLLALILTTVLGPVARWLRQWMGDGLAAALAVLGGFLVLLGVLGSIVPSLVDQVADLAQNATDGIRQVQDWASGPPLNVQDAQVDKAVKELNTKIQEASGQIAGGVFTGVSAVASAFVTGLLTLVLTFFFVRDGHRFLPWLSRLTGRNTAPHVTVLGQRLWRTLGGYVRGQAVISFVDAVLIGIGLLAVGVPMWASLAVLTFLAGFVPIVGAVVVGALSVLVALVTVGFTKALIVLAVVLLVQNVEGNILQPIVQGKAMELHEGLVLLSVAVGSSLFGVAGAFLAVPVAASIVVVLRYLNEQIDARSQDDPLSPQVEGRHLEPEEAVHLVEERPGTSGLDPAAESDDVAPGRDGAGAEGATRA
ncbi:Predicted PurR-regulated permease PerM [Kytococcus aerolatus]|uniref:Predicted PurR-regulated permease PerM n=1 Tax=Kytococcus aerolatus TaxID=592308 RepID=A0A212T1W0_9MICO|nr:AI-2E family transporter [Kytococcus aerolatus]SNC60017.1 Predicted PurR-regulated permease PerM [Kytococcus aerolatus]